MNLLIGSWKLSKKLILNKVGHFYKYSQKLTKVVKLKCSTLTKNDLFKGIFQKFGSGFGKALFFSA